MRGLSISSRPKPRISFSTPELPIPVGYGASILRCRPPTSCRWAKRERADGVVRERRRQQEEPSSTSVARSQASRRRFVSRALAAVQIAPVLHANKRVHHSCLGSIAFANSCPEKTRSQTTTKPWTDPLSCGPRPLCRCEFRPSASQSSQFASARVG